MINEENVDTIKRIETVELEIGELKTEFGNPRKINAKKS